VNINIVLIHIKKIVQNNIAFGLVESDDLASLDAVHEERFLACSRMYTDNGVEAFDWTGTGCRVVTIQVFSG
jgi:hypothetical protein